MPSRHGSERSLDSPPSHPRYTMDMDTPLTNHYEMYDAPTTFGESSGMGPVRPKRKQVKNACSACQRACKRCDVGRPCERCIKYGMADSCRDSQRKERKKGIKRGPYKKRDGECAVPPDVPQAHSHPGLTHDQRMSPKRIRASVPEVDLSNLIQIDDPPMVQVQQQVQQTRPEYSYTPLLMSTPPLSLAGMHQHPQQYPNTTQASSSYHHSEEQYYSPRYDHLQHAPTRPHFRPDDTSQDYSRHVQPVQDYSRSPVHTLQYPSPEQSPPRERQYTNAVYHDNSSRHPVVQPVHHDPSYQSQSDSMAHDHDSHDPRVMDSYYATHQHQPHQRPYSSEGHMSDVHQQQDQQQSYYPNYNAYQQSTGYASSQQQYAYSQAHAHAQPMSQTQTDPGYSHQHLNYASAGSSISTYPTQSHHQMDNSGVQYSMRSPAKMVHRGSIDATSGMVAHPHPHHPHHQHHHSQHVGNVQIQSN
ncbi:unnamed protein product [Rhizoctonia solani]|uniref:Zn(2)-C6 fungal-type domain-containing protein n=1 Tax=Rhizoctonia solani TaxID=456999 RepID=A0A8H3DA89_9AGAM|nr:unnamed protein product [Rhizoctonia solani]